MLVIAGAHRKAALDMRTDMAHTTNSVFQSVHDLLVHNPTDVSYQSRAVGRTRSLRHRGRHCRRCAVACSCTRLTAPQR
ncbi:hypothetical protein JOF56_009838 [Kibdelosporangium banguiense]|uniref:Uncharacterized protein n=1 Tax=Kibdelosporangium banguiense TaxID=1365924 RepID=A0ABS4TZN6_9PSEU|nr:hypothetical protein [Kibdelosporangium banguiense]